MNKNYDSVLQPGTKVIVRSNSVTTPLSIGTLQSWYKLVGAEHPVVRFPNNPESLSGEDDIKLCFSIVIPYTPEMYVFLSSLSYHRQWEILSQLVLAVQDRTRHEVSLC
mgnify:CR=1 FL=1